MIHPEILEGTEFTEDKVSVRKKVYNGRSRNDIISMFKENELVNLGFHEKWMNFTERQLLKLLLDIPLFLFVKHCVALFWFSELWTINIKSL